MKIENEDQFKPGIPVKTIEMDEAGMARMREIMAEEGLDPLPERAKIILRFQHHGPASPEEAAEFQEKIRNGAEGLHMFPVERDAVYNALRAG
jgi:hypothetical protein